MADRDQKALIGAEVLPDALQFHYVKGTHFRTVHVDGIWGGPTGRGYIHAVVYTERHPIPRVTEAKVVDQRTLGPEEVVDAKKHFVREAEADLIMDLSVAKAFRQWLDEKIMVLEAAGFGTQSK